MLLGIILLLSSLYWIFPYTSAELLIALDRNLSGLEVKTIQVNGVDVDYLLRGEGEPVILLHGLAADKDHWNRFASELSNEYAVYAPDLPGFGHNHSEIYQDYSIQGQVRWLHQFASELGLDSFHLVGNSMGGTVAGLYAACHPNQVKSLYLLAPAGVDSPNSELFTRVEAGKPNPLFVTEDGAFDEVLDFLFYETPYIPDAVMTYHTANARSRREHFREIFFDLYDYQKQVTLDDVIEGLQVPVKIVWGKEDRVLHPQGGVVLVDHIEDAQLHVLKETGHLPMLEKPQEVAGIYQQFLAELW